jgi:hypothetical protein
MDGGFRDRAFEFGMTALGRTAAERSSLNERQLKGRDSNSPVQQGRRVDAFAGASNRMAPAPSAKPVRPRGSERRAEDRSARTHAQPDINESLARVRALSHTHAHARNEAILRTGKHRFQECQNAGIAQKTAGFRGFQRQKFRKNFIVLNPKNGKT